jgi:hypothetical protein
MKSKYKTLYAKIKFSTNVFPLIHKELWKSVENLCKYGEKFTSLVENVVESLKIGEKNGMRYNEKNWRNAK